ncbi:DeoR/GlpR transcriptional regulator [Actinobacteria bacterium YIM 96077]|uniref:DeoR family transcriptional regulator n=1 Tax=Phytoactinopolyspora halophila TaxID=1981511 RepID=A0A329QG86_9ACTN|nr:DeoR/GlpR family DNA-binding transcription regulator [Phytoactinopolyspora halophila]AYY14462.1 DeoR/GlpR transcriptional regulator [Actinobacteria bacterium YIM 96077]RAW11455.1 DeoR family transcriptional regulator [Phytoactinopolyspora halophila]
MLAAERQAHILDEVQRRGAARVRELAMLFQVSDMTIRRDLDALVSRGALDKVHGGATSRRAASTEEPGFDVKSLRQQAEKDAIARVGAELVAPGSAVGLSAGTTTWALAQHLRGIPQLTIVTNSLPIADTFHHDDDVDVVVTGGVRTPSDALVGPIAVTSLRQLHLDLVFLGVHGIDLHAGFTTPNLLEAETDRALVTAGHRLIVVADHTKWATVGLSTIATLGEADVLVCDAGLPGEARHALDEHVGELILASEPDQQV